MKKTYTETIYQTSRKRAGLTQEAAAEKIGCSRRAVALWESGVGVTTHNVVRMAKAYDDDGLVWRHLKSNDPSREYLPGMSERCMLCMMRGGYGDAA